MVISPAVAFAQNQRGELRTSPIAPQLTCGGGKPGEGYSAVAYHENMSANVAGADHARASKSYQFTQTPMTVRRLTPVECERLQGFPDGWTEGQADSSRYKQMGNAVAVPVVEWIARRMRKEMER